MTPKQPNRKLRVAFIFMPINGIRPPVSLTGVSVAGDLIMDEIARPIGRSHDVVAYCARGEDQQKVEQSDGVEYRRMSTSLDHWFVAHHKKNYAAD